MEISRYTVTILYYCINLGDGTKTSASGAIYKPTSKILQKIEEKSTKEEEKSLLSSSVGISSKPLVCRLTTCAFLLQLDVCVPIYIYTVYMYIYIYIYI